MLGTSNKKMEIELPYFGKLNLEYYENEYSNENNYVHFGYDYSIGETYGDEFKFQNKPLDLDVNFLELSNDNISLVTNSLNNLEKIIENGKKFLHEDFNSNGEVKKYINNWIEYYLEDEPFKDLARKPYTNDTLNELLKKLGIVRVGFYALSELHPYIVMDFAFGYDIDSGFRDNMLIIKLDSKNNLIEITTEG